MRLLLQLLLLLLRLVGRLVRPGHALRVTLLRLALGGPKLLLLLLLLLLDGAPSPSPTPTATTSSSGVCRGGRSALRCHMRHEINRCRRVSARKARARQELRLHPVGGDHNHLSRGEGAVRVRGSTTGAERH